MNKAPLYKIKLGNADGIKKMSLVEYPAVESNFLAFDKQTPTEQKFSVNDEQHIVYGVALRANYPIYRYTPGIGEYYVVFDKDSITELYEDFMINGRENYINLNHNIDTDGVYLIQSFIKDSKTGINPVGFEDIEDGSWLVAYKVLNDEVWAKVKAGDFNGFSIEGDFILEDIDDLDELLNEILN